MNTILKTFVRGLLALLPVLLTVFALVTFFSWLDRITRFAVHAIFPAVPAIPGIGIVIGAAAIFALGVLVSSSLTAWLYRLIEIPFRNIPVVKDLYTAVKQLTDYLSPGKQARANQVVAVRTPDGVGQLLGLVMRQDLTGLPEGIEREGRVAVYLPMSYQIGGFTVFLPRDRVTPVDMPVETAMRQTLTGWLGTKRSGDGA
ncbi:MAG: DUF502 domain-containing protein [Gammaproteobacteria bacterium]|nr:DUF502 domain-containing protein [Gammaproteobacteria bacterium]